MRAKSFRAALDQVITQTPDKLRQAAAKLVEFAAAGEGWAIRELADRLDGRPAQAISISSELSEDIARAIELGVFNDEELDQIAAGKLSRELIARISSAAALEATGSSEREK